MKKSPITISANACAYSAALIADAQAAIVRATESVQHSGNMRRRVKRQRGSTTRTKLG